MSALLANFLARRARATYWLLTLCALVAIALFDYVSGPQLSLSIAYLVPIGLATWYLGLPAGMVTAGIAGGAWLTADLLTNPFYASPLLPLWNAAVRLGIFLIVAYVLASLNAERRRQEDLIAFVVHDLRSPLANMLSGLDLIQAIAAESALPDDISMLAKNSQVSGRRMLVLVDSLLDLRRLERGKMPVRAEKLALEPLLADACGQLAILAAQKGVAVETQVAAGAEFVRADPDLLTRVLVNLLGNALKFSPARSAIRITAHRAGEQRIVIAVADEGPGIPDERHRAAFARFQQVGDGNQRVQKGSGLGLAFCRMAVEAQGGRIALEQGRSAGTVVLVTLTAA